MRVQLVEDLLAVFNISHETSSINQKLTIVMMHIIVLLA
jgi:hypothetical protein